MQRREKRYAPIMDAISAGRYFLFLRASGDAVSRSAGGAGASRMLTCQILLGAAIAKEKKTNRKARAGRKWLMARER